MPINWRWEVGYGSEVYPELKQYNDQHNITRPGKFGFDAGENEFIRIEHFCKRCLKSFLRIRNIAPNLK